MLVSAPSCTPRCARARGARGGWTPRRAPIPSGAVLPPSPEAAAGRTGRLRPWGWHRAPRAGEVPAFLMRLQVEQWAGARGGDAAALSVRPCVSASGHPWDAPTHAPLQGCPTPPLRALHRHRPRPLAQAWALQDPSWVPALSPPSVQARWGRHPWVEPWGCAHCLAVPPLRPDTPQAATLSPPPRPWGRRCGAEGWAQGMLRPSAAPQSGAADYTPHNALWEPTDPTHCGVARGIMGWVVPGGGGLWGRSRMGRQGRRWCLTEALPEATPLDAPRAPLCPSPWAQAGRGKGRGRPGGFGGAPGRGVLGSSPGTAAEARCSAGGAGSWPELAQLLSCPGWTTKRPSWS